MNSGSPYKPSLILFATLPVACFLLFGFHGMDAADRGFIPALAYRILSGEVMYHDFFYVRPPLSPYFHTIEMALLPESWEMIGYRFVYYWFMWLPIYWSIRSLERYFDFGKMGVSPWILGAIAYVLSLHNFFAAPWHTLDGIFFAALGLYFITRSPGLLTNAVGLFCMGLAALTKQPFGIVPIVGIGLVFWLHGWKRALSGSAIAIGIAGLGFGIIEWLLTPDIHFTREMLHQTVGVSSLNEMRWGGYQLYVRPAIATMVPGMGLWLLLKYVYKPKSTGWPMAALVWIGFAIVGAGMVYVTVRQGAFVQPKTGFIHGLMFAGGAIAAITFLRRDRNGLAVVLAMWAVAWASGVSWGYAIPILYTFPSVFAIGYFLSESAGFRSPRWYWPGILGIVAASMVALNFYVYHDGIRPELRHDLGAAFAKLSHIRCGDEQFANYSELKSLHERYGDNFEVLPSLPLAHYVTNTAPMLPVDWAHDAEINYQPGIDTLISRLNRQSTTVFAMRSEMNRAYEDGHYRCSTLRYVLDNWQRVDSTSMYYVYQPMGRH